MTPRTMRRVYLREAAVMLVLARLAVRFVPPGRIFAWADRPPRPYSAIIEVRHRRLVSVAYPRTKSRAAYWRH